MRPILLAAPALFLAGCATAQPAPAPSPSEGMCRGDGLSEFVGQPATAELGAQLLASSGATALRWVAKGQMVTMDYRDDRLTVQLDAANRVERANCG